MGSKNIFIWIVIVIVLIVGLFFIFDGLENKESLKEIEDNLDEKIENSEKTGWISVELEDVRTGEKFKLKDLIGKPILLESFAVWCPTCTKQQREIKKLHDEVGDSVVSISLDTDQNEDKSVILDHINKNGFDWRYAVSPIEMTRLLIDDLGNGIINAPSAPVVLICEDGNYRKLKGFGSRDASELKKEIERGC